MFKDVKNDFNRFSLKNLEKRRTLCKFTSERQELIQMFVDKINTQRGKKFKDVTWSQINGQLKYCNEMDLKYLWNMCEKAKHFSAYFWHMTKVINRKYPMK